MQNFAFKFQAVAEKTAKKIRGLLYFAAPCTSAAASAAAATATATTIGFCLTDSFFQRSPQVWPCHLEVSPKKETLVVLGARFSYRPDALPVTQPTAAKH